MKSKVLAFFIGGFAFTFALAVVAPAAIAMTHEDYLAALKLADSKVQRVKSAQSSDALSSTVIAALYGRYYAVGDYWDVAAWRMNQPMGRMTDDETTLVPKTVGSCVFHYEVISVKTGTHPQVVMQVTQKNQYGLGIADEKIEKLTLTMNDRLVQSSKAYYRAGSRDAIAASSDGFKSPVTPLELFPLDVPELQTALRETPTKLPELPEGVARIASQTGFAPNLGQSAWFEQDDFFGRPVQVLWQQGDPWPAYMKTTSGISILISKGTL